MLDSIWSSFAIEHVRCADDALFGEAWTRLWDEFGERGEIERREVLADRLTWDPQRPVSGYALLYEMIVIRKQGQIVAIRDHTAVAPPAVVAGDPDAALVVHLSHVLVEPALRGSGLAAWLRAIPVETARRCLARARAGVEHGHRGRSASGDPGGMPPVTLVAEMEHDDGVTPAVVRRLRSYAQAGFRVADPAKIRYCQPDFRDPCEIDRTGAHPVPLCLVIRRVGREQEEWATGAELREAVCALQAMFAVHVRPDHMQVVRNMAAAMPSASERVALLVPGSETSPLREVLR